MVERLFNLFRREFNGLQETALLLGVSAIVSQVLALFRDRLLASTFGAGSTLDVYYAAFRIPDLLYVLFASFVSVMVVLPFLLKHLEGGEVKAAGQLLAVLFSRFCFFMVLALTVAYFFMPQLTSWVAPGFTGARQSELLDLSRILLLSPLLLGLSSLFANITQSSRKFFLLALSPILYNLGIIGGILFLFPRWGSLGLVWGVVFGALLHFAIQWPAAALGPPHPRWLLRLWPPPSVAAAGGADWKRILVLAWPRMVALSAQQLTVLILVAFASSLAVGSITVFNLAYNLQAVLLSVIGVSYAVASFPFLVRSFANSQLEQFVKRVALAVRYVVFWSLPAAALFLVLRAQIIRVILGAGAFDWRDTRLTAAALALFLLSVVAQGLTLLFVRVYYASGRTFKPLVLNVFTLAFIVVFAWLALRIVQFYPFWLNGLGRLLRVSDVTGIEFLVLPLAFTLGAWLNLFAFWKFFERDFGPLPRAVYQSISRSVISSVVIGSVAYLFLKILAPWVNQTTFWGIFQQGWWAGVAGILAGSAVLKLLNSEELVTVSHSLKQKFWRRAVQALPPTDEL